MSEEPQFLVSKNDVTLDAWGGSILLFTQQPAPKSGLFWSLIYKSKRSVNIESTFCLPNLAFVTNRTLVESQQPQTVPSDLSEEIHVAGDAISVTYRKLRSKYLDRDS
jgi:hypothetical protein